MVYSRCIRYSVRYMINFRVKDTTAGIYIYMTGDHNMLLEMLKHTLGYVSPYIQNTYST